MSERTYFGGKGGDGVFQTIINQIPPHEAFVSGFLGRCAIMRNKKPAEVNIGVEIDPNVINMWSDSEIWPRIDDRQRLDIVQGDFLKIELSKFLKEIQPKKTFVYLDPPYPLETRKSRKRYRYEMDDADHHELVTNCSNTEYMMAISSYPNDLYDEILGENGWRWIDYKAQTRSGKPAAERLYMNYPEPERLHDTRYLGSNYREREKYKLRAATIVRKLERLSILEREAVLQAIRRRFMKQEFELPTINEVLEEALDRYQEDGDYKERVNSYVSGAEQIINIVKKQL